MVVIQSDIMPKLRDSVKVQFSRTSQANGLVEVTNQTILEELKRMVTGVHGTWGDPPHLDKAHLEPRRLLVVFDGLSRQVRPKSIFGLGQF
ncbi:hypothetical protein BHE74_00010283 [Ensete ventricosum]|nr:hypothetical protein BHE74_00010283 [Ensete ventricosum]